MTTIATTPDAVDSKPMGVPRVNLGRIAAHLALLFFVVLWTFPTVGLLISSVRDKDQLALTGWWTSLSHSTLMAAARPDTADKAVQDGDHWVIKGNLFGRAKGQQIETFGLLPARGPAQHYDADALVVAKTVGELAGFGLEPRHLRSFKAAAGREVGLIEQVVTPLERQRDSAAKARAEQVVHELAALTLRLHTTLVKIGLRNRH